MKYILEVDKTEMDEFIRIFFNGVTVPVSTSGAKEKRIINKVTAMATRYEESLIK